MSDLGDVAGQGRWSIARESGSSAGGEWLGRRERMSPGKMAQRSGRRNAGLDEAAAVRTVSLYTDCAEG
jgi:hypothetical protein